ncbi:MAG: type II toxin-antitoxin system VapC family toxin [Tunicatimonas sp.]
MDTDICIFLLQGKYGLEEKIKRVGLKNCYISEITIAELKYGAENSNNYQKHILEVEKIERLFTVIPIYGSFGQYAKEKARLRKEGTLIPDFDLLIGVTAVTNDLVMVTNNEKHLSRISSIQLENWTKANG